MVREWEEDLPYSSPIFLWALQMGRKIAAGVLYRSLSLLSSSFCIPFFFHFFSFSVRSVMYREGFSLRLCANNAHLLQATRQAY